VGGKNNPIKFGTDGWRAVIAEDFTFDNVRFCAQGTAEYLKQEGLDSRGLINQLRGYRQGDRRGYHHHRQPQPGPVEWSKAQDSHRQ